MTDGTQDRFELNHAISYTHYVTSLPLSAPQLPSTLPRLRSLLSGLLAQGKTANVGSSASSSANVYPGGSSSNTVHAQLCEGLVKAFIWISWTSPEARDEVASELVGLFAHLVTLLGDKRSISELHRSTRLHRSTKLHMLTRYLGFPLVILKSVHSVLSTCVLPSLPLEKLSKAVAHLNEFASPANLVKFVRRSNSHHSPASHQHFDPRSPCQPQSPGEVVMIVSEVINVLLAGALLPDVVPDQGASISGGTSSVRSIQAQQIKLLLAEPLPQDRDRQLSSTATGNNVLQDLALTALRWWDDLTDPRSDGASAFDGGRQNSLLSMGDGNGDEEIELTVAVLVGCPYLFCPT